MRAVVCVQGRNELGAEGALGLAGALATMTQMTELKLVSVGA